MADPQLFDPYSGHQDGDDAIATEVCRVEVAEVHTRVGLMNGTGAQASFFLRPTRRGEAENESLLDRLNDQATEFIVVRSEGKITLMHVDAIAYVWINRKAPELTFRELIGASRRAAEVRMCTGETLVGHFVSLSPPNRSRLSDLLNEPRQRFLLFASNGPTYYVNARAIQQVSPR
jgi:hypothetical protein